MELVKSDKRVLIRTIYLYLFSLVGLVLLTIGTVSMLDLAMRTYIFKQADMEQKLWNAPQARGAPYPSKEVEVLQDDQNLTASEREALLVWLKDYQDWKTETENIDPIIAHRQQEASHNLAFILVGLPLFLFHWRIIRRETRNHQ